MEKYRRIQVEQNMMFLDFLLQEKFYRTSRLKFEKSPPKKNIKFSPQCEKLERFLHIFFFSFVTYFVYF